MADSESWAAVRAYLTQTAPAPASQDETEPAADPDTPDETPGDEPEQPERRRAFRPGRVGSLLDAALPTGIVDRAARIPTPGGLFPILAALIFFLFAIVPVGASGQTRLQLIWQALTGAVELPPPSFPPSAITARITAAEAGLRAAGNQLAATAATDAVSIQQSIQAANTVAGVEIDQLWQNFTSNF